MTTRVRINLVSAQELQAVPGLTAQQADAIVKHRAQHGPITDAKELAEILGNSPVVASIASVADFTPADSTAPEAPGA
jgi:DNA uptake protein ComE-like DNA-binding protein